MSPSGLKRSGVILFRLHPAIPEKLRALVDSMFRVEREWTAHVSIITEYGIEMVPRGAQQRDIATRRVVGFESRLRRLPSTSFPCLFNSVFRKFVIRHWAKVGYEREVGLRPFDFAFLDERERIGKRGRLLSETLVDLRRLRDHRKISFGFIVG
jgi:hypothetical protein